MLQHHKKPTRPQNPWLLAIRPKTLPAGAAPVIIGTAMAVGDGVFHIPSALVALAAALLIQIGTNLANDYFDFQKGADTADRIGPTRVVQAGLVTPETMVKAITAVFLLAALAAGILILRGGWPIVAIAVLSIASGILYTAGPYPLAYLGLGEIFVLVFFGPVAVAGTYYVQSLEMNGAVITAGLAPGLLSAAILAVNNLRDIDTDRISRKNTLAVRFGRTFAQYEYAVCLIGGCLIPIVVFFITYDYPETLWACLTVLLSVGALRTVFVATDGPQLNRTLAVTGQILIVYTVIFSIGWCWFL